MVVCVRVCVCLRVRELADLHRGPVVVRGLYLVDSARGVFRVCDWVLFIKATSLLGVPLANARCPHH